MILTSFTSTHPRRLTAHLSSVTRRLSSYLQYIGFVKYGKALENMNRLQDLLVAWRFQCRSHAYQHNPFFWQVLPIPCQHYFICVPAHSAPHETHSSRTAIAHTSAITHNIHHKQYLEVFIWLDSCPPEGGGNIPPTTGCETLWICPNLDSNNQKK